MPAPTPSPGDPRQGSTAADASPLTADWNRIDQIFGLAIQLPLEDRDELLSRECGEDLGLRSCVERLLDADRDAETDGFLGSTDNGQKETRRAGSVDDALIGSRIGSYRLVEKIADGGTGIVFRAERMEDFQQQVAIKILRIAFQDEEGHQRFWAEKQALAQLAHPNIARILDASTAPDGSPYLVMELIEGGPIDEYCEVHAIPLRQKLEWFHAICRAVAFAHGRGILHRDLKPGNVLITHDARPVITDFGLAKFVRGPYSGKSALTTTGTILGTPGYMAPEQAGGSRRGVDFATDVYGLGAILYALLAGRPPFRGDSVASTLLKVQSEDPISPRKLARSIPRDLDNICLHCLEKDPARRYGSVALLSDDVQRYLHGLPVLARRLSWTRRSLRWIARNRVVSLLFGVICMGLVAVTWLLLVAEERRELAEANRREARAAVDKMFSESSDWLSAYAHTDALRRRLLSAALDAYQRFAGRESKDPELLAEAAAAAFQLGIIRQQLGETSQSVADVRAALGKFEELAHRFPKNSRFQFDLFHCRYFLKEYAEAFRIISELCQRHPTPEYRDALAAAAGSYGRESLKRGDPATAIPLFQLGMETAKRLSAESPHVPSYRRHVGTSACDLSTVYLQEDRFSESLELARQACRIGRELLADAPHDPGYAEDLCHYCQSAASAAFRLGEYDTVRDYLTDSSSVATQWTTDHPDSPGARLCLVTCELRRMHLELALGNDAAARLAADEYLTALEKGASQWPKSHDITLNLIHFLASSPLEDMQDLPRASRLASSIPENVYRQYQDGLTRGIVLLRGGQIAEAIRSLKRAVDTCPIRARSYLALAYLMNGDVDAARSIMPTAAEWDELSLEYCLHPIRKEIATHMAKLDP